MSAGTNKGSTVAVPVPSGPGAIRNVVLVGPSGSGKTVLFEHLVAACAPGHRPDAQPGRTTTLTAASLDVDGTTVNLLDTPGYADFVGDLRAGLRAADAAVFVLSAADGVDAATSMLWHECAVVGMPRAVAATRLEAGRGDLDDVVAACRRVLGDAQPLYLPVLGDDGRSLVGTHDLLREQVRTAGTPEVRDADADRRAQGADARAALVEAIIAACDDDTLLERYLDGEQIDADTLAADLRTAVAGGTFFPVVPVCPATGAGVRELLDLVTTAFPTPAQHPLPLVTDVDGELVEPLVGDPDGPLVAEVVRTATDPYLGRVALVRVFDGTLRADDLVHVAGHRGAFTGREVQDRPDHDLEERVGPLSSPLGEVLRPKQEAVAGDLVVVARLAHAETGDTLSATRSPVVVEPWLLPEPLLPVAVHAATKADEDKLASALARLVAEDVTLRLEHAAETHQLVLWTLGQAHVDLLVQRLRERHGVVVQTEPLRVALRETFLTPASGQGRHVKQSGGHGQFAVCRIDVEPLPAGSGIEFVDAVVGGAVPRQFIPSVEKGVRAQAARGTLAGYPLTDVRVTLTDGRAHAVDSSDMAFQTAGALALKDATSPQSVALLEPVDDVDVEVADDVVGAVMSDLTARRGRVGGTEPAGEGRTIVHAEVPALELVRYAIDLRSVAHGTGTFTRRPARWERMPRHLAVEHLGAL